MFDLSSTAMQAVCAMERRLWRLERCGIAPEPSTAPAPPDVIEVLKEMDEGRISRYRGQSKGGAWCRMPSARPGLPARAEVG